MAHAMMLYGVGDGGGGPNPAMFHQVGSMLLLIRPYKSIQYLQMRRMGARPWALTHGSSNSEVSIESKTDAAPAGDAPASAEATPSAVTTTYIATIPGMPRLTHTTPRQFFNALATDATKHDVTSWHGELYLELHQVAVSCLDEPVA